MDFEKMQDRILFTLVESRSTFDNRHRLNDALNRLIKQYTSMLSDSDCLMLNASTPEVQKAKPRASDVVLRPTAADMARQAITDALRDSIQAQIAEMPELAKIPWSGGPDLHDWRD